MRDRFYLSGTTMEPMANIALRAARLAGQQVLRGFDRPDLVDISNKNNNTYVTNIDREAEYIAIETLRKKYPHHKFTGEESGSSNIVDAEYEWVIDPIDGTTNFTRLLPNFCVSIACLHRGKIEHGVILDPIRQEEFVASRGKGCTLNGKRIRVSAHEKLAGSLISSGNQGQDRYTEEDADLYRHLLQSNCLTRQSGCVALDLAYIAAGRLDGLYLRGLETWNMAAGILLITEAGGLVGDMDGGANPMGKGSLIAGSPKCFKQISLLLRKYLETD
jgi:myo-inositol-1(or 4)-monophosphatase